MLNLRKAYRSLLRVAFNPVVKSLMKFLIPMESIKSFFEIHRYRDYWEVNVVV